MTDIEVHFFDVGGALLTNGSDRDQRRQAASQFGLDWEEFQDRHEMVADAFETGRLNLGDYLTRTVFHQDRAFSRPSSPASCRERSLPNADSLSLVGELAGDECFWPPSTTSPVI